MKITLSEKEVQQATVSIQARGGFATFRMGGMSINVDRQQMYEKIEYAVVRAKEETTGLELSTSEHSGEVFVTFPMPDTAPLSPPEVLTCILETIQDRRWEMPRDSSVHINASTIGVRFDWRAKHSLCIDYTPDGTCCDVFAWRQDPDNRVHRVWHTTTKANIDAALEFLLGQD